MFGRLSAIAEEVIVEKRMSRQRTDRPDCRIEFLFLMKKGY
jgi:hypothetical protein